MKTPDELLHTAENRLKEALAAHEAEGHSAQATEFYELRIQAAIFNYDICREVVLLWKSEPKGFALKVALKNVVHKLYEYDKALSGKLVNRVLTLARAREIEMHSEDIRNERKKWQEQLSRLQKWADVRNETSGHYGKNIAKQVGLLKQIDREEVMAVAAAFLAFNIVVLKALTSVGRG